MTTPKRIECQVKQEGVMQHDDFAVNTGSPLEWARFEEAILDRIEAEKAAELAANFEGIVHQVEFGSGYIATRELAQVA